MHQTGKGKGLLRLVMVGWILAFMGVPVVTWSAPKAVSQNLKPPAFKNIPGQSRSTATSTSSTSSTASSTAASSDTACAGDAAALFTGDISIGSSVDLSQLAGKCVIEGDLTIKSDLQDLDGLAAITHVTGSLNITGNPSLTSVSGLRDLKTIGGVLWITENNTLANIKGLDSLKETGGLVIEGNPSLTSISGFKALRKVTDNLLAINDNDKLTSIMGFAALATIDKDLNIYGNAALTTLNTLNALRSVGGNFKIWENTALVHIAGFQSLMSSGSGQSDSFTLAKNTALKGVSGLAVLGSVQNLTIQYNSLYPTNAAECLASQLTVKYYKLISYNGTATTDACARTPVTGDPTATQTFTGTRTSTGTATGTGTGTGIGTGTGSDGSTGTGTAGATATGTGTGIGTGTGSDGSTGTGTAGATATGTGTGGGTDTGSGSSTGTGTADATATGTGTGAITAEIDFTAGKIPDGVTNVGCELADGRLQLGKNADGTFVQECYVEFTVSGDQESGKMIRLDATRMDLFYDGDFASYNQSDVGLYAPTNTANQSAKTTGKWFSNAGDAGKVPASTMTAVGDQDITLTSSGSLMQILPIKAGQDIRLDFAADTAALNSKNGTSQLFYLSLEFLNKDFRVLKFFYPINDTLQSSLGNFKHYDNSRGAFENSLTIRGLDCNEHVKYNGDGISPDKTGFNLCQDADGVSLTDEDGKAYSEDDIAYVSMEFATNWSGTGTTTLKSVSADPLDQFEISLLDAEGSVIQTSDNDDRLYLETFSGTGKLRVSLKSGVTDKSPTLSVIHMGAEETVSVTAGDQEAKFTKPRMGFNGAIPPVQEWADSNTVRTQCLDFFDGNKPLHCYEFLSRYGMGRLRVNIPLMHFATTVEGTTITHEIRDGSYTDKIEPATTLRHLVEAQGYGMEILMIVDHANCEGSYYFGTPNLNCYWDTSGNLNPEFDTTPDNSGDNGDNSAALMKSLAQYIVTLFDGGHEFAFSDGTVKFGKISYYEIGVETNIVEPIWKNNLSDDEEASYLAGMGTAIHEIDPTAQVETSVNPYNSYYVQTFHHDYIDRVMEPIMEIDSDSYTHFNFNLFTANPDVQIEDWIEGWVALQAKPYFANWQDKKPSIGAYDVTHNIYDPACNDSWEKDNGMKRASKLMARMILTGLSLPVEDMYDYLIFNSDGYSASNNVKGPEECWRSTGGSNIFDRLSGGYYDGKDEPTQYKLNEVGIATMVIAKNLSISSPYVTTAESAIDGLFVKLFTNHDGDNVLAVWRQDTTEYAVDYMDYISGHRDDGDTRKVLVNIDLKNISATTATRIPLDGTASSDLSVDGTTIKDVLLDGDMPVLIHLKP